VIIVRTAFAEAVKRLVRAGVDSPRRDARALLAVATNRSFSDLAPESAELTPEQFERFEGLVRRRMKREPLAYIVGHKEFWSLDFDVGPGVLVPRPESETLVEALCGLFPDRNRARRICDLGTGSACLIVAALSEFPNARGDAIERTEQAFAWAVRNVTKHGLQHRAAVRHGDWSELLTEQYDAILANPPYIAQREIMALIPEVARYEPTEALDGGPDGLDAYRAMAPGIAGALKSEGAAFLEIGAGQADEIREILEAAGLNIDRIAPDLAGIPRCVVARPGRSG
jgi:release factor glutamine methyltransferase